MSLVVNGSGYFFRLFPNADETQSAVYYADVMKGVFKEVRALGGHVSSLAMDNTAVNPACCAELRRDPENNGILNLGCAAHGAHLLVKDLMCGRAIGSGGSPPAKALWPANRDGGQQHRQHLSLGSWTPAVREAALGRCRGAIGR